MATGDITAALSAPSAVEGTTDLPVRANTTETSSDQPFDIVKTYRQHLSDPEVTKPLAAIEALIEFLGTTPAKTVHESLELVRAQAKTLMDSVPNPIPLQAGTDLFQQYLLTSLKQQEGAQFMPKKSGGGARAQQHYGANFDELRMHLLKNSRLFASRAKEARARTAEVGARYVLDGQTILTHGGSRTVSDLLLRAAEQRLGKGGMFRVIYVESALRKEEGQQIVASLREKGVPVATITEAAVAYSMPKVDTVFVGAETVCQNGGIISRLGTFQVASLASQFSVPFYVAAETHKMVKVYPLSQFDLPGVKQDILNFRTEVNEVREDESEQAKLDAIRLVDYTPPNLVSNLITEVGVKMPSAVFELLLNIYD